MSRFMKRLVRPSGCNTYMVRNSVVTRGLPTTEATRGNIKRGDSGGSNCQRVGGALPSSDGKRGDGSSFVIVRKTRRCSFSAMCVLAILAVSVASTGAGAADNGSVGECCAPTVAGRCSHGGALVALCSCCCLQPSAMAGCVEGSVNGYEGDGPWPDVQDAPGAIVRSCDRALLTTQSTVHIQYANPF